MSRWFRWSSCAMVVMALAFAAGCANTDGLTPARPTASSSSSSSPPPHLITPESDEDLSKLSDDALHQRITAKREQLNQHMNATFIYATRDLDHDLSQDSTYKQLLRKTKQAETDLTALEREAERREAQRGEAGAGAR